MRPDWFVDPARSGRVDVTQQFVISFRVHSFVQGDPCPTTAEG